MGNKIDETREQLKKYFHQYLPDPEHRKEFTCLAKKLDPVHYDEFSKLKSEMENTHDIQKLTLCCNRYLVVGCLLFRKVAKKLRL